MHGQQNDKYTEMHGQQNDKYTEMHGQQNDKYTEMQGQQNDKYTEMHGQQNVKNCVSCFLSYSLPPPVFCFNLYLSFFLQNFKIGLYRIQLCHSILPTCVLFVTASGNLCI
jgi:hypothetical protein